MWLSLVHAAQKAGDFRTLYPRGMKRVDDVPWFLQEAVNHAIGILSWHENYVSDELPAQTLWDDAQAIEEHFDRVRQRKEAEREGYGSKDDEDAAEPDMTGNDLASVFKR